MIFYKSNFREQSEFTKNIYIGLPIELNSIISDFVLEEYILELYIIQYYQITYPFIRPFNNLISCKNNFTKK